MTEASPINWQKGVQFYGDEEMFKLMVESYENLPFTTYMKQLYDHVLALDYSSIKTDARTIKGIATFIAAEKCQEFAQQLENSAIDEDEAKVVENYLALVKESKVVKAYIATITNKKNNAQELEMHESEIRKKYKTMSSYSSRSEIQRQFSRVNPPTLSKKQSPECNHNETESPQTHQSQNDLNQTEKCKMEEHSDKKQCPGCNECSIF